jgi:hypothetical protein
MELFDTVVCWMDTNLLEEFAAPFPGGYRRNPACSQLIKLAQCLTPPPPKKKTGLFTTCNEDVDIVGKGLHVGQSVAPVNLLL